MAVRGTRIATRVWLWLGLAAFVATPAFAQDARPPTAPPVAADPAVTPATKRVSSADGSASTEVPVGWEVEVVDDEEFVLTLIVSVPESAAENAAPGAPEVDAETEPPPRFRIRVLADESVRRARPQPFFERDAVAQQFDLDPAQIEASLDPIPHLTFEWATRGRDLRAYFGYRRIGRQVFVVTVVEIDPSDWLGVRAGIVGVVQSLETTRTYDQPCPEGYTETVLKGVHFQVHPDVPKKEVAQIKKRFTVLRKAFESDLWKLDFTADSPPIVLVHSTKGLARAICVAADDRRFGQHYDLDTQRLFVVPFGSERTMASADFAQSVQALFIMESFGRSVPTWIIRGLTKQAAAGALTGKAAPVIPERFGPVPLSLPPLERQLDGAEESFFWLLFFRAGPVRYRKAFDAVVAEATRTFDWDTAVRSHLLSLDQEKLLKAANAFVAKKVKIDSGE